MQNDTDFYSRQFVQNLNNWLWPIIAFIFRIEVVGLEHIRNQKSLLIANHNSGALIESHSLLLLLFQRGIKVFGLNHRALFLIPLVGKYFRKIGAVSASAEQAKSVLNMNHPLLIFPGGNRQAFRPLSQRHHFSFPWSNGWAKIAFENHAPVVPIKFIGTHQINPILFTSKFLSNFLILPRLLKVTWFPVSLAQLVLSSLSFMIFKTFAIELSSLTPYIAAYLTFCFTPLVPILPAKVKIKIYPPLQPDKDYVSEEDLIQKMQGIMDRADFPSGKRTKYSLNSIEKFMHAHESDSIHYNSQLVFEFEGHVDSKYLLAVTDQWINDLPHLRTAIDSSYFFPKRYSYERPWFLSSQIFHFSNQISQVEMDEFCQRKFHLGFDPGVRFLLQSEITGEKAKHRLIFSCHHSLFDGAGQAFAFECWAKIFKQIPTPKDFQQLNHFRYRSLVKHLGLKTSLLLFLKNFSLKPPRSMKNVATLATGNDLGQRFVSSQTINLGAHQTNLSEDLNRTLEAFHRSLKKVNSLDPIFVLIPLGLRWALKIKSSMQNAVVSANAYIKQSDFLNIQWKKKIKEKLSQDLVLTNQKFLFGTLPTGFFLPTRKLKNKFLSMDAPGSSISSSILFVHAPIPRSYPVPTEWKNLMISARGTLLRSPNVGVIITGQKGSTTLTVEYIKDLVKEETINFLMDELRAAFCHSELRQAP